MHTIADDYICMYVCMLLASLHTIYRIYCFLQFVRKFHECFISMLRIGISIQISAQALRSINFK